MLNKKLTGPAFYEGDEVVLAEGTYQGSIRQHPMVWLAPAPEPKAGTVQ